MSIEEKLVFYATKAPSGHNTQPWNFKIRKNNIEIHPDLNCSLPVVDPCNRELFISLGCAVENMLVAARVYGYNSDWSIHNANEQRTYINVELEKSNTDATSTLLENIETRQTNRASYNSTIINDELIHTIDNLYTEDNVSIHSFKNGEKDFLTIKKYILRGNEIQMNDPKFKNELLEWIRFNKKQMDQTKNGLTYEVMEAPQLPKGIGKLIVKSFLNPIKQNITDTEKIDSSSHFVVLTTKSNTKEEWIALGITLERLLLKLTELGIAYSYLNPPCEIENLADELSQVLFTEYMHPTIILRIGFSERVPYSPRKEMDAVVI